MMIKFFVVFFILILNVTILFMTLHYRNKRNNEKQKVKQYIIVHSNGQKTLMTICNNEGLGCPLRDEDVIKYNIPIIYENN